MTVKELPATSMRFPDETVIRSVRGATASGERGVALCSGPAVRVVRTAGFFLMERSKNKLKDAGSVDRLMTFTIVDFEAES